VTPYEDIPNWIFDDFAIMNQKRVEIFFILVAPKNWRSKSD